MSAEDDRKATQLVLDALQRSEIGKINFQIGGVGVTPRLYQQVTQAIAKKTITVMVAPTLLTEKEGAKYIPELKLQNGNVFYDLIVLRSPDLGRGNGDKVETEAMFVHECTHAGFNLIKAKDMTHALEEAAAYTAEALFEIARLITLGGKPEKVIRTRPINIAAWALALLIWESNANPDNKYFLSPDFAVKYFNETSILLSSISDNDEYRNVAKLPAEHLGVGRTWIIPPN